jgi:hypothetical protein
MCHTTYMQAKLHHFEPQHLSNALWALAKIGFYPGAFEGCVPAGKLLVEWGWQA